MDTESPGSWHFPMEGRSCLGGGSAAASTRESVLQDWALRRQRNPHAPLQKKKKRKQLFPHLVVSNHNSSFWPWNLRQQVLLPSQTASRPGCDVWPSLKRNATVKSLKAVTKICKWLESTTGITQIASRQPLGAIQNHALMESGGERRTGMVPWGKSPRPAPRSPKCKGLSENGGQVRANRAEAVSCHGPGGWDVTTLHPELLKSCWRWSSSNAKCDFDSANWLWWWRAFTLNADCVSVKPSAAAYYILLNNIIKLP